jgi:hypothetical protein
VKSLKGALLSLWSYLIFRTVFVFEVW